MATRNLTEHFLRARSAAQARRPPRPLGGGDSLLHSGGGAATGGAAWDTSAVAPIYVELVEDIQRDMGNIQKKSACRVAVCARLCQRVPRHVRVCARARSPRPRRPRRPRRAASDLERLHRDRLLAAGRFDTSEADQDAQIETLTAEVARVLHVAGAKVKRLAPPKDRPPPPSAAAAAELAVRSNIQRGLAQRLNDLSRDFRSKQKAYLGELGRLNGGASFAALTGDDGAGAGASGGAGGLSSLDAALGFGPDAAAAAARDEG
jgi:hypothetical protein